LHLTVPLQLPLLATYSPAVLGATSEAFGDRLLNYLADNPDGLLRAATEGKRKHQAMPQQFFIGTILLLCSFMACPASGWKTQTCRLKLACCTWMKLVFYTLHPSTCASTDGKEGKKSKKSSGKGDEAAAALEDRKAVSEAKKVRLTHAFVIFTANICMRYTLGITRGLSSLHCIPCCMLHHTSSTYQQLHRPASPPGGIADQSPVLTCCLDITISSCPQVDPAHFAELMRLKYMRALAAPGEAVGVLAAQSVGESVCMHVGVANAPCCLIGLHAA
jgi:hypothetical protein